MATAAAALVGRRGDPVCNLAIPNWQRLTRLGRLGVLHGEIGGQRIFVPTGNPEHAIHLVTPVIERGRLVDIVAFRPEHLVAWGRRTGIGTVLVSPTIERAWPFLRRPLASLTLHRRPIDWLRAGRQGACIVNWRSLDTGSILGFREIGRITVPDSSIARRLTEAVTRPVERPDISIDRRPRAR